MTNEMMLAGALCLAAAALAALTILYTARRRKRRGRIPATYAARFLGRNRFGRRHTVYVSRQTHDMVAELVHRFSDTGADITAGGFIDNVVRDHLARHKGLFARLAAAAPHNDPQEWMPE